MVCRWCRSSRSCSPGKVIDLTWSEACRWRPDYLLELGRQPVLAAPHWTSGPAAEAYLTGMRSTGTVAHFAQVNKSTFAGAVLLLICTVKVMTCSYRDLDRARVHGSYTGFTSSSVCRLLHRVKCYPSVSRRQACLRRQSDAYSLVACVIRLTVFSIASLHSPVVAKAAQLLMYRSKASKPSRRQAHGSQHFITLPSFLARQYDSTRQPLLCIASRTRRVSNYNRIFNFYSSERTGRMRSEHVIDLGVLFQHSSCCM